MQQKVLSLDEIQDRENQIKEKQAKIEESARELMQRMAEHAEAVTSLELLQKEHDDLSIEIATRELDLAVRQHKMDQYLKMSHNEKQVHLREINEKKAELVEKETELSEREKRLERTRIMIEEMKRAPPPPSPTVVYVFEVHPHSNAKRRRVEIKMIEQNDPDFYKYIFVVKVSKAGTKMTFEGGEFANVQEFVDALNQFYSHEDDITTSSPISFSRVRNHVVITPQHPVFDSERTMLALPYFDNDLRMSIGIPSYDSTEMIEFYKGWEKNQHRDITYGPVDLKGGYANMFVYTDIVQPRIVGDTRANILRTIGIPNAAFGENVSIEFKRLDFLDLGLHDFDTIRIAFNFDDGTPVPFKFGRTIVQLIFQRK